MNKYLITALFILLLSACFSDLGNYDYIEINETSIDGLDNSYTIFADVGVLHIEPIINMSIADPNDTRFEYLWVVKGDNLVDTISQDRVLNWQANIPNGTYTLSFRIIDKETGMIVQAKPRGNPENSSQTTITLNISVYHSRGIMLIGENKEGYAQAQMITMLPGYDEIFYDNILQYSELPKLTGPIDFFHTGTNNPTSAREIWIITKSGSYFLNRLTLKAQPNFNIFNDKLYFSESTYINPLEIAPKIKANSGATGADGNRFIRCSNGGIYISWISFSGDLYDTPVNDITATGEFGRAKGEMLYPLNSYSSLLWYDQDHERFVKQGHPLLPTPTALTDKSGDVFPWIQNGRTYIYGENTFNTDGGSTNGNSFAIMKEIHENHERNYDYCIYKMYCNGPAKRAFYTVDRTEAPLFGTATMYAFSSLRTIVFYVAGGKLYAYNYDPAINKNYEIILADNNEITMAKFDVQREPKSDYLYVATYNASTGGTLYKYSIDPNLNFVRLKSEPEEKWTGLVKIRNMNWRGNE
ncbi:MAG TPA: hypothetical protein DEF88_01900 [Porphyromonadaceae bacterium]|jgi:hypothetical protein|nr:hypothetical protein [Porphyromonadaceae bacterium]HCM19954.1 hypothetical protein [Porphyromonadaceae bacterium]